MLVLGIESTCDETACAIVKDGREILSSVIASQADIHNMFGGVVPELSCRQHVEVMIPTLKQCVEEAGITLSDINLIAVAYAPGLIGALLLGLNTAKALSLALGIPFVGVNHVEAHLYAALMSNEASPLFPCLGVVVSGGHTALWDVEELGTYHLIGHTVDDAIGEAFDKTAKLLGLPYPGGPHVESLAAFGDPQTYSFRAGQVKGRPFDFSFSGLKTAVLYAMKHDFHEKDRANLAASFQDAALIDVINKTALAARNKNISDIILGGGVTNNLRIRALFRERAPSLRCFWPTRELSLDNAAMIAGLGFNVYQRRNQQGHPLNLEALTRLPLSA